MARSFSNNAKLLSTLVVDGFSSAISRRGYAVGASSQGVVNNMARGGARNVVVKKPREEMVGSTEKVSWVPDPKTGYYKPETGAEEIDPAELRAILLKKH